MSWLFNHIRPVRTYRDLYTMAAISGLLLIGLWAYVLLALRSRPDQMPLHYTIYFGIDLFGSKYQLLRLPGFATAVGVVNSITAAMLVGREKIAAYFLIISSLCITVLVSIATVIILRIIT